MQCVTLRCIPPLPWVPPHAADIPLVIPSPVQRSPGYHPSQPCSLTWLSPPPIQVLSAISLALFADSGWYEVRHSQCHHGKHRHSKCGSCGPMVVVAAAPCAQVDSVGAIVRMTIVSMTIVSMTIVSMTIVSMTIVSITRRSTALERSHCHGAGAMAAPSSRRAVSSGTCPAISVPMLRLRRVLTTSDPSRTVT